MSEAIETIQSAIRGSRITLFMKGSRSFPMCGFSAATIQILDQLGAQYQTVDVLQDPEVREAITRYSNWPTIPQLYIDAKFVGGADIIRELYETGELEPMVKAAASESAHK
ncbi:MAG: Grx4 family monothiol glutaredoxin [Candidatus Binataceae bacterium]